MVGDATTQSRNATSDGYNGGDLEGEDDGERGAEHPHRAYSGKKKNFHTAAPGDSRGRHHGELVHERPCVVEEVELLERA